MNRVSDHSPSVTVLKLLFYLYCGSSEECFLDKWDFLLQYVKWPLGQTGTLPDHQRPKFSSYTTSTVQPDGTVQIRHTDGDKDLFYTSMWKTAHRLTLE